MTISDKYLEALKTFNDYVLVSQWAEKVAELYPDLLKKANKEAQNQANDTTGIRELSSRISSRLSTGGFDGYVKIDDSERPKRVKYITKEELEESINNNIEEDLEPLTRQDIEKESENSMAINQLYRLDEFRNIQKSFKKFFSLDFELDHATALLNTHIKGEHHPNNMQLLLKYHNGKKNNKNWKRFTIDEQIAYIKKTIELQSLVSNQLNINIDENIINSLFKRLISIF